MTCTDDNAGLALVGARGNAEWCDIVCRSHGIVGEFTASAWISARRTPLYYPDAVTLAPTAYPLAMELIDSSPGCSIKDSFAVLDLTDAGFHVLFQATWIHRLDSIKAPAVTRDLRWSAMHDADELRNWENGWGAGASRGIFQEHLLDNPRVLFVGGSRNGQIVAGGVVSRSESAISVSNVFSLDPTPDAAWAGVLSHAERWCPSLPLIGYERGNGLAAALRNGFTAIGSLQVWSR